MDAWMPALTSHGSDGTERHPGLLNEDTNVRFPGALELNPGAHSIRQNNFFSIRLLRSVGSKDIP